MSSDKIAVGIIGTGNAGRSIHMPKLQSRAADYEVVACADVMPESAQKFAADFNLRAHDTVDAILAADDVDLLVVATRPPSTHRDIAVAAFAQGKHVVVEKPMAGDENECTEMIEAAQAAGRVLSVHHNRRWDVDFLNAYDAMRDGVIGTPRLVRNEYATGFTGSAFDWGIHIVDQTMCLSLGKRFTEIAATVAHPNADNPLASDGFFTAHLLREDGAMYEMSMLPTVNGNAFRPGVMTPRFALYGTEGVVFETWCQRPLDAFGGHIRSADPEGRPIVGDPTSVTASLAIPDFYDGLATAIRTGGEPPVTPESGRRAVKAWELMCKAACGHGTMAIDL